MAVEATIRVEGLEEAMKQTNDLVKKIQFRSLKGLIRAGLFIQREAQKQTPIDTGNLRASAYTIWWDSKPGTPSFKGGKKNTGTEMASEHSAIVSSHQSGMTHHEVEVGFTAAYAIFVHEDLTKKHAKGNAKFLEKAVKENQHIIEAFVREEIESTKEAEDMKGKTP